MTGARVGHSWLVHLAAMAAEAPVVRAVVIGTVGSTPRECGAAMLVSATSTTGTIGGGALEYAVIERARSMLEAPDLSRQWQRADLRFHLGPELNQCCGGVVRVLLERFGGSELASVRTLLAMPTVAESAELAAIARPLSSGKPIAMAPARLMAGLVHSADDGDQFVETLTEERTPVVIYGAGHVGRAVVAALGSLPFAITWADTEWGRYPADAADLVDRTVCLDLESAADLGGRDAFHLVMTHSHALDEIIITELLRHNAFAYLGLIGSGTKWARFRQRLMRAGLAPLAIERVVCPIGLPGIPGKAPAVIAASVAADLLLRRAAAAAKMTRDVLG